MACSVDCDHPYTALRDEVYGTVCTNCGTIVDSLNLDDQPSYVDYAPSRGPAPPAPRNSTAAAIVHREEKREMVETKIVETFVSTLRLGDATLEVAKEIFTDAVRAKQPTGGFRGAAYEAAAASAVYYACKVQGFDRTEGEVASNCGVNISQLASASKVMRRLLSKKPYATRMLAPIKPSALVHRFVAAMREAPAIILADAAQRVQRRLTSMTHAAETARTLEGKTPECACVALCVLAILEVVPNSERKDIASRCAERAGLSTGAVLAAIKATEQQRVAVL
jgi:transcription initiation factor TFIIIB Brf1 subunit/transcription initiation factor TFIIB